MERCDEVGQRVKDRRTELGLRQDGIDGVSSSWLRRLEKGEITNPRESTLRALERGLRWGPGAVDLLSAGLAIEVLPDPAADPGGDDGVVEVFARLRQARLRLADSDVTGMDEADRAALRAQAIDLRNQLDELLTNLADNYQAD